MKKVFFTFIMILATQLVYAQAVENLGSWERTTTEADELKGEEASDILIYTVAGMGDFVFWPLSLCSMLLLKTRKWTLAYS